MDLAMTLELWRRTRLRRKAEEISWHDDVQLSTRLGRKDWERTMVKEGTVETLHSLEICHSPRSSIYT